MCAVRKDNSCTIKYVEQANNHLVLRPQNAAYPVEVITMEDGQKPGDYIVGRVCYVGIET
jgi:SOS-response transcriptional repressor LexA